MTIHVQSYDNATLLHDDMCEQLMFGDVKGKTYDWVHGTEVGLHNIVLEAEAFDWDFNLRDLWIPPSRWTMMVRQYLNYDAVDQWLNLITDRMTAKNGRGIAVLRTNTVAGRGTGKSVRRRWGSCMLNFSFRRNPYPQITLTSRTTYFGYLAALDITVGHALARLIDEAIEIDPSEMRFVWNLELAQFHGFRSLAWPLMQDDVREQMEADLPARMITQWAPGYRKALDGYSRIYNADANGKLYGDEKFSSFNRVRRRFHTEVFGAEWAMQFGGGEKQVGPFAPLPSTPAENLDILRPLTSTVFTSDEEEMDDDE